MPTDAETGPDTPVATTTPAPERAAWWEDFLDIFYSPSQVFERRRDSGFLVPLVVLVTVAVTLVLIGRPVLQPVYDSEMVRGLTMAARSNPNITPERIEQMRSVNAKLLPVYAGFGTLLAPLVVGLVLWAAARAVEARITVGAACMVATFAFFPRLLEGLLNIVQGYVLDPATLDSHYRLTLGPARFFGADTTSPIVLALLGRLDVFTIWVTVLLAIGLSVVARIPRARAAAAAVLVYIAGALPSILQAVRSS